MKKEIKLGEQYTLGELLDNESEDTARQIVDSGVYCMYGEDEDATIEFEVTAETEDILDTEILITDIF